MDMTIFCLGLVLIIIAAIQFYRGSLAVGSLFGSSGIIGCVYSYFITKSQDRIKTTADRCIVNHIVFFTFLTQMNNYNSILYKRLQKDKIPKDLEKTNIHNTMTMLRNAISEIHGSVQESDVIKEINVDDFKALFVKYINSLVDSKKTK